MTAGDPSFTTLTTGPITIEAVEVLRYGDELLVRATSTDGGIGLAATTARASYLHPIITDRIAPCFIGRDARDLEILIDDVYRYEGNYKLTGVPFWCCVAWVEFSVLDLLGRVANRSVLDLLGGARRREVPVYLSLLGRTMTTSEAVERLARRAAETGADAVKVKIGGRMSGNADVYPGRTEALITALRERLASRFEIYADANGSYDVKGAIEVGRLLEASGVGFFEEPCPFERYGDTRRVADALSIPVAGGEQDSSLDRWHDIITTRVVDLAQPDLVHLGGFLRTRQVASIAAAHGLPVWMHNPHRGPTAAYVLQFAALLPDVTSRLELTAEPMNPSWSEPSLEVRNGALLVPNGPGLGVDIDIAALKRLRLVRRVRRAAKVAVGLFRPARGGG